MQEVTHSPTSPIVTPVTPSVYGTASAFSALTTNPELITVNETIDMLKASLGSLGVGLLHV